MAALSLCSLAAATTAANAASVTVDCHHLQSALNQAQNGDTITLDQLCTKSNSGPDEGHFGLGSGAAERSYSLVGKPGSGAGFDGTGVSASVLQASGATSLATFTIRHLIFKNGTASPGLGGGAILLNGDYALRLDDDAFLNNHAASNQSGGAVEMQTSAQSGQITITHSTFHGNVAGLRGGALDITEGAVGGLPTNITQDRFTGNAIQATIAGEELMGGAVNLNAFNAGLPALTQKSNRFSGNSITGGTKDAFGGAEALNGVQLSSTSDSFTDNSIEAPPGASYFSEGSALSISNVACNNPPLQPHHVAMNLAIAGNSIAKGKHPANGWGALYLGCVTSYGPNNLALINSTVSGNRGGGGTAGIWGDGIDHLVLRNSIVAGNSDGGNLFGFNPPKGSITVTHTDLCKGTSPYPGPANICASPHLVNALAGNVRETYSSPTIDKGSNLLVPHLLTTDAFGQPRIQSKLLGGPSLVDMGAAEFPTVMAPDIVITRPAAHAAYRLHARVHSSFHCTEAPGGPGIRTCHGAAGQSSGALINTSTAGQHTFKVVAISRDGLKTVKKVAYSVRRH